MTAVLATAAILLARSIYLRQYAGVEIGPWVTKLLVLAILFLVCDSTPPPLTSRRSAWSPSSSATLAAVVMLGPLGAARGGATARRSGRRGGDRAQRAGNAAMYTRSAGAAGRSDRARGGAG